MRPSLALAAAAGILLAVALVVTVPPTAGQGTEVWWARDATTGPTDCTHDRDLSLTGGTTDAQTTLTGSGTICFSSPTLTETKESGTWTSRVLISKSQTGGLAPSATILLQIVDSAGGVLETLASCNTGALPDSTTPTAFTCEASGVGERTLDGDRLRLRVDGASAGTPPVTRHAVVHYNNEGDPNHDTRMVVPQEAVADPCEPLGITASDPAGELWFNETVEPDGQPFTTQFNVSASFQNETTPALSVRNDGSEACDITLRLMGDPGTGRSMKFNTTSEAPWPDDASRAVPVDPDRVTVCTAVPSGGTCDIWLWVDYEDALGGSEVIALRVESV